MEKEVKTKTTTTKETKKVKTWREVFIANYEGKSDEAKLVEDFVKANYKGNKYIPWATMEKLTYLCDENAKFENVYNANGGLVFTDECLNAQKVISDGVEKQGSTALMFSHTVRVKLIFMGKEFIEDYPIQDQDYTAAKIYNQNLVNRALQRAKAKVASRATGIGLKLYEGSDLQFDEVKEETKPVVEPKKTTKKVEVKPEVKPEVLGEIKETKKEVKPEEPKKEVEVKEEPTTTKVVSNVAPEVTELVELIKETDKEKMNAVLQKVNPAFLKKKGFVLSTEDTEEELTNKIASFEQPNVTLNAIRNLLG